MIGNVSNVIRSTSNSGQTTGENNMRTKEQLKEEAEVRSAIKTIMPHASVLYDAYNDMYRITGSAGEGVFSHEEFKRLLKIGLRPLTDSCYASAPEILNGVTRFLL